MVVQGAISTTDSSRIHHYRYGFNGQEKTDEISGSGNHTTAEFWEYDTRLGRRWNNDPVVKPWISSYHAFSNKPIINIDPNGANDDWYENKETKQLVWKNSEDETIEDESGTYENIGDELLTFDGDKLNYWTQEKTEDGILKLKRSSIDAVSGRQKEDGSFDYSKEAQSTPFTGPLPEGDFTVKPDEIQWWTNQSVANRTAAIIKKGSWPGGLVSWGIARVWLNPQEVTLINPKTGETVVRDDFSIHGGLSPGSAGCIVTPRQTTS